MTQPLETHEALVPTSGPRPYSLAPRTFEDALRFAAMIAKSDLAPKDYKGKPENCLIAMQMGAELGLAPMQAIQNIAVINGRPAVWGDAMLALVYASPVCEYVREADSDDVSKTGVAWTEAKRRGGAPVRRSFSMADAAAAGLKGKQGPWTQYPFRMLQLRARGFALRDAFPDVLKGLQPAEEVLDYGSGEIVEQAPTPPPPTVPRRASAVASASPAQPADQAAPVPAATASPTAPADLSPPSAPPADRPVVTTGKKKPAHGDADTQSTRDALITGTRLVTAGPERYYEIEARAGAATLVYVTRSEQLYKEAASVEGFDHHVLLTWQHGNKGGTRVRVLTALALDEGQMAFEGAPLTADDIGF